MDLIAGVDFGGTSAKIGLVDAQGALHGQERVDIDQRESFERILEPVMERLHRLVRSRSGEGSLVAVGIGTPGFTDKDTGILVGGCENIPGLKGKPIQDTLSKSFGVPAFADNDATCAAAGELAFGAGKKHGSFLLITIGTGIGGGLALDGRIFRGSHGFAAEVGHICLDPNGLWCNCGSRGCFEQYASGPAIVKIYSERLRKRGRAPEPTLTPRIVAERARGGEPDARDTFEEAGQRIAQAFGIILNLLDLEACIIGGGVSQAGEILLAPVRRHLPDFCWPLIGKGVEIVVAELGNDAGVLGAAAQALERLRR